MRDSRKVFCTKKNGMVEIENTDMFSKGLPKLEDKKYESCHEENCMENLCKYSLVGVSAMTSSDMLGTPPPNMLIDPTTPTKEGCFIATACYGSPKCPEVIRLCKFRDDTLLQNVVGKAAVALYYRVSPVLANWIKSRPLCRNFVKKFIVTPLSIIV